MLIIDSVSTASHNKVLMLSLKGKFMVWNEVIGFVEL